MDTGGKPIDPTQLRAELASAGIPTNGIGTSDPDAQVYTFDDGGVPLDLPPEARPVVDAHDAGKRGRTAAFEATEDAERLAIINERASADPAFAALADYVLKGVTR